MNLTMTVLAACSADVEDEPMQQEVQPRETDISVRSALGIDHGTTYSYQTEETWCQRGDNRIYGELYVPQGIGEQLPLVMFSHGFGGSHSNGASYARTLAEHGYMVYCLDFCGGSNSSRSDGATTEMSIRTEEADLKAVIDQLSADSRVDAGRIYLMGAS